MGRFANTKFKDLQKGFEVKYPARGENSKKGIVIDVQSHKEETSILVRWDKGGVSTALKPNDFELLAKKPTETKGKKNEGRTTTNSD